MNDIEELSKELDKVLEDNMLDVFGENEIMERGFKNFEPSDKIIASLMGILIGVKFIPKYLAKFWMKKMKPKDFKRFTTLRKNLDAAAKSKDPKKIQRAKNSLKAFLQTNKKAKIIYNGESRTLIDVIKKRNVKI